MALIKCPECSREISSEAKSCPGCGVKQKRKTSIVTWIALILLAAYLYHLVEPKKSGYAIPQQAVAGESKKSNKPALSKEERERLIVEQTKTLSGSRDKMSKISFFSAKDKNLLTTRLDPYIAVADMGSPVIRMREVYFGDDWVFVDKVRIMCDDEVIYERSFDHNEFVRNNSGGSVWETGDYVAREYEIAALRKILAAKETVVRFEGRERQRDHTVTKQEVKNLRAVLTAYDSLTSAI